MLRQNLWLGLLFSAAVLATQAQAACPQGQEPFTSCQIEGRNTEVFVCFDDQSTTYRYGPIGGAPELFLTETTERVDYEPWSGSGKAISESVTFYNGDYAYEVGGGFDRPFSEEEMLLETRRFGWIEVTESGERAASLTCIPDTVGYGFGGGIHDIKVDAGQTWDPYSFTWVSDLIQPTTTSVLIEQRPFGTVEHCLPTSEFRLGGVGMGDPLDTLGKLGTPEMVEDPNNTGEAIDRITLIGGHIDIFQDAVVAMLTTAPHWQMPSGLRVGLTRGEVIRILGRVPDGHTATSQTFAFHACAEGRDADDSWTILIDFGQDKRVESIHFVSPSH